MEDIHCVFNDLFIYLKPETKSYREAEQQERENFSFMGSLLRGLQKLGLGQPEPGASFRIPMWDQWPKFLDYHLLHSWLLIRELDQK